MKLPNQMMIVEDEAITQRYLKNILEQYHIECIECYDNAEDSLSMLKTKPYDMILMDINIKGSVDGIQLAREILRTHQVPIVFITAHNDDETFQEVLELSPYGFISKPFSAKDVEVTMQLAYKRFLMQKKQNISEQSKPISKDILITKEYIFVSTEQKLYYKKILVKLNMKQNKLLEILSQNLNNVVTYEKIISIIWGDETISDSALRTLVYTLRKAHPNLPIISHSKVGYSLHSKING